MMRLAHKDKHILEYIANHVVMKLRQLIDIFMAIFLGNILHDLKDWDLNPVPFNPLNNSVDLI